MQGENRMNDKIKSDERTVDIVRGLLSGTALDENEPKENEEQPSGRGVFKGDGIDGRTKGFKATVARINTKAKLSKKK